MPTNFVLKETIDSHDEYRKLSFFNNYLKITANLRFMCELNQSDKYFDIAKRNNKNNQ